MPSSGGCRARAPPRAPRRGSRSRCRARHRPCDNHTECVILSPWLRRRRRSPDDLLPRRVPCGAAPRPRSRLGRLGHGARPSARRGARRSSRRCCPARRIPSPAAPRPALTPSRCRDADLAALAAVVGPRSGDARRRASGCCTSAARAPPTCCAAGSTTRRPLPTPSSRPPTTTRSPRCSASAPSAASPSSRSAAARRVVGGVDPERGAHRAVIALDLARTAALLDLDEISLLATFGAGTTGPQAEELLGARGFTLGHFPQSFAYASIGGYAATRSSGQASRGYGRFDDLVHALRVATPAGELTLGRAPASAAGPDLRQLFLGSEGAFGVLTEVTVRVRPVPAATAYGAWTFPDFAVGRGGAPRGHAARHPSHRAAAERRDRDARERRAGRPPHPAARMPRRRDLRGRDRRRGRGDAGRRSTRSSPRTAPSRAARTPPARGSAAASPPPRCATPSSTSASSPRPSRPRRPGRSCPRSSAPSPTR